MQIYKTFTFEASHQLDKEIGMVVLHGHSYWVDCYFETSVENPTPLPMISGYCGMIQHQLDHKHLNDIIERPTMESIAEWIYTNIQMKPCRVIVRRESIGCGVEYVP